MKSKFIEIDGVKLHYRTEGSGPDILLIHGLGANIYSWRKIIPILAQNHRVWAVDLKGFGHSAKPIRSSYSLKSQSDLLGQFARENGIEKLIAVGNSMGGSIATQMALDFPDLVSKVILLNFAHNKRILGPKLNAARTLGKSLISAMGLFVPSKREFTTAQYMSLIYGANYKVESEDVKAYAAPFTNETESYYTFLASLYGMMKSELSEKLHHITQPVLILWGNKDKILPSKLGKMLHKEIPGSKYVEHPTAGHHIQEEEPEWVSSQIISAL